MPNVPKIIIRELVPFLKHLFVERQHVMPGGRHSPWVIDSTLSFLAVVLFRKSVTFSTSYYKKYTEIRNILHERILPSQIDTTVCFFFCDLGVRIWPANSNITTSNSSAKAIMAALRPSKQWWEVCTAEDFQGSWFQLYQVSLWVIDAFWRLFTRPTWP